ncbi:MAG: hypothetical protein ACFCVK_15160 [Acidimicrobiales bacterium]
MTTDSDTAGPRPSPVGHTSRGHLSTIAIVTAALALPVMLLAALVLAVVPGIPWWVGLPIGLAVAAVVVGYRIHNATSTLLDRLRAVPADPDDYARFHNLTQGLALGGGVAEPDLYVIDDEARNAAAIAQGDRSAIVATTGLLTALDRIGLEAVVAEAMVRIRTGDAEAATMASALFGSLVVGPASLFRPLAGLGFNRLLPDDRELRADRAAVALTRYPPGLVSAFAVIRAGSPDVASSSSANDHLWLVPPSSVGGGGGVIVRAAPLDLRIDVLGEL